MSERLAAFSLILAFMGLVYCANWIIRHWND